MTNVLFDRLFAPHIGSKRVFLHHPDGGETTYGAFLERAAQIAAALKSLGLSPGDRLALQIDKCPDALAIYAACAATGIIYLPLNTAYTGAEMAYFIKNSGARLVISAQRAKPDLAQISEATGARLLTLESDGTGSFAGLVSGQAPHWEVAQRGGDDLAAFLYTSGTTGRSKGAMLTQENLLSNAEVLADHWRFTKDDVLLHALPVFHTHGLFVATNIALLTGSAMIFLPKFDVDAVIRALPKATVMMGVPTFYTRLLDNVRFGRALTQHMRLFVSGSAPLLAETHERFEARTGHRILERYGMTETNMNTSNPYDGDRRAGTVGLPLPGIEVKVCDAAGAEVPKGEIGTLEVRGPNVFKGYWQMPEKTAEELRKDGFFITGDLARIDGDGYVTIVGRGKDLIITGGYNVYPKEVELVLDELPGVKESAVIGAPHRDFGEGVVAVLVADGALDMDQVTRATEAALARFKQPRHYVVVDALPRNTMGKVQKNLLRETYAEVFDQAPGLTGA